MAIDLGTGTTVVFGTSAYPTQVIGVSWNGINRDSIPTSTMATTGGRTFIPSDTYNPGELVLELLLDPNEPAPVVFNGVTVPETVTITTPIPSGGTSGATYAASMFITGYELGIPWEDRMTSTVTLKASGNITQSDSV